MKKEQPKSYKLLLTFTDEDRQLLTTLEKTNYNYNVQNYTKINLQQFILMLLKDKLNVK